MRTVNPLILTRMATGKIKRKMATRGVISSPCLLYTSRCVEETDQPHPNKKKRRSENCQTVCPVQMIEPELGIAHGKMVIDEWFIVINKGDEK